MIDLYYADKSVNVLHEKIESGLGKLEKWCHMNKLSIYVETTKYMFIKPRGALDNISMNNPIMIGNSRTSTIITLEYVIIDDKLVFDKFLKDKCNKINIRLYQLCKMQKYITRSIPNIIYKQAIISLYDYADFLIESGPIFFIEIN